MIESYSQYITPSEAVQLGRHQLVKDIKHAREIYETAMKQCRGYMFLALGTVFRAGYIAGIRAERAKRRKQNTTAAK